MIYKLFEIIQDRKANPQPGSYTNYLLDSGSERLIQKMGEEAIEVIVAAGSQGDQRVIEETADLIYHLLVLLASRDIQLVAVEKELAQRHSIKDGSSNQP